MRILQTSSNRKFQAGLSLVEVLTVLVILGFASVLVVMAFPTQKSPAQLAALKFATTLKAYTEQAIIKGEVWGVKLAPDQYQFLPYLNHQWKNDIELNYTLEQDNVVIISDFFSQADAQLQSRIDTRFKLNRQQNTTDDFQEVVPDVILLPSGQCQPALIQFSDGKERWQVTLTSDGDVTVTQQTK
ncbi:MAG: type II secretion system minor pseudopilin GspH [bacterium]